MLSIGKRIKVLNLISVANQKLLVFFYQGTFVSIDAFTHNAEESSKFPKILNF